MKLAFEAGVGIIGKEAWRRGFQEEETEYVRLNHMKLLL